MEVAQRHAEEFRKSDPSLNEQGIIQFDCRAAGERNTQCSSSGDNEQNVNSDKHDFGGENGDRNFD
jgi:hypothetical protein